GADRRVTLSAGLAAVQATGDPGLEAAFRAADTALYAAKAAGRNRALLAPAESLPAA
ncbi:MAG: diguanylate cyclase, partial [Acetobacteraceae bacterium]|nr:diguanylate cyclase [Acetobacteraceae bacterium]